MKLLRRRAPFALLAKDLSELAARRRTYVVRSVYAALLFLGFMLFAWNRLTAAQGDVFGVLGSGGDLFGLVIGLQFLGIYLILPAFMCSAITYEKERNALALVFLTDLTPTEILLQKYVARMMPMLAFILLSLPLLAVCYSLGGLSDEKLFAGAYMLLTAVFQVGAISLFCSAMAVTTVGAFIGAYLVGGALYLCLPVAALIYMRVADHGYVSERVAFALIPFAAYGFAGGSVTDALAASAPVWATTLAFLLAARTALVRRAFAERRSLLLMVFKRLDRFWNRANRLVGGIVLVKDRETLPEDEPVAWREIEKRGVGKPTHLARILLLTEAPVVLALAVCASEDWLGGGDMMPITVLVFFLWPLAALLVVVKSVGSFVNERTDRTLDVLLTTPMTGAQIVRQKARAVRRVALVLAVPIATAVLVEAWLESGRSQSVQYLLSSGLSLLVYLSLCVWVSMWIGLRLRSRPRAVVAAVVTFTLWCILPYILLGMAASTGLFEPGDEGYLWLTSPATMVAVAEFGGSMDPLFSGHGLWSEWWVPVTVNYAFYGGLALLFRYLCLRNADRYLGRSAAAGRAPGRTRPSRTPAGSEAL